VYKKSFRRSCYIGSADPKEVMLQREDARRGSLIPFWLLKIILRLLENAKIFVSRERI